MIMDDPRGISTERFSGTAEGDRDTNLLEPLPPTAGRPGPPEVSLSPQRTTAINDFGVRIHGSLNPQDVIATAVHELRPILGCERICYLERRGTKFHLQAASGHAGIPRRSRPAAFLEEFVSKVLTSGQRFLYPDEGIVLPDDIGRRLADYWDLTNGQLILVEPVFSMLPPAETASKTLTEPTMVGAIVVEQFSQPTLPAGTLTTLEAAMKHLTPALKNCREHWKLASIPGLAQAAVAVDSIRKNTNLATLFYLSITALVISAAGLIQQPFEIECRGKLMPRQRREVFASIDGEVVDVEVAESQVVAAGQVLCRLQSRELEKSVIEQTGLLKGKLKARDAARAELRSRSTPQARSQSARDQAQLELINAEIETINRQLKVLEQEESQLKVCSPISGTVMTERPGEKLRGRPVRRGEPLLEILQDDGGWQLELAVAERRLGHLLSYSQSHPNVKVKFRMLSSVQQPFECQLTRLADRTVASAEAGAACVAYCDVSQLDQLTHQVGSEVSARIQCGQRSLLYIWFHEFWELLQRNWWV